MTADIAGGAILPRMFRMHSNIMVVMKITTSYRIIPRPVMIARVLHLTRSSPCKVLLALVASSSVCIVPVRQESVTSIIPPLQPLCQRGE